MAFVAQLMVEIIFEAHGKAVVARGNTFPVKDLLKGLGGSWNRGLNGWIFDEHVEMVTAIAIATRTRSCALL